jgi:hypothetical protein
VKLIGEEKREREADFYSRYIWRYGRGAGKGRNRAGFSGAGFQLDLMKCTAS